MTGVWIVFRGEIDRHRVRRDAKQRKEAPFDIYLEPVRHAKQYQAELDAAKDIQHLKLTLKANVRLSVERVHLIFSGQGAAPTIKGLYDWGMGVDLTSSRVEPPRSVDSGAMYWDYGTAPFRRPKGNTIKIGIKFIAADWFDGHLSVQPTLDDQEENKLPTTIPITVVRAQELVERDE